MTNLSVTLDRDTGAITYHLDDGEREFDADEPEYDDNPFGGDDPFGDD